MTEPHASVPRVLLVTGSYFPEISAGGVQCRAVAAVLEGRVSFSVLTTAVDATLPQTETIDDVRVFRLPIDVRSPLSKMRAAARLVARLTRERRAFDIVHLHGVSQKNVPVTIMARLLGKRVFLTLHTAGADEPESVRRQGRLAYWAFTSPDLVLSVSPYLSERYQNARVRAPVRFVANGIDITRFRPVTREERARLRRTFGWSEPEQVVLFVGFFSRDKRPDLLFGAWRLLCANGGPPSRLVFIGAKGTSYGEIDQSLAPQIRADARELGTSDLVEFVEPTNEIEKYFQAADVFVLPSVREAQSLALLEAMACGLPTIATQLPGATDVFVEDGVNGHLFPADDEAALAGMLRDVLADRARAQAMGVRARETVTRYYDIVQTAEQWLAAYQSNLKPRT